MKLDHDKLKISKESVLKFFPEKEIDIPPILDYESPIKVIMGNMRMEQENNIFKAVQEYGVDVDKDELIKALQYDREQYEKGYINGYLTKTSDLAREIFEEIEKSIATIKYTVDSPRYIHIPVETMVEVCNWILQDCIPKRIAELKKKYMESEKDDG